MPMTSPDMTILITMLFFVFVIGSIIGSFLNVVILRAFSGESIVLPPSKCPKCGNKLKWWHNIPILSYILLGGKCGFCKEHISFQYPIVEFITGVLFVMMFIGYGARIETLFGFAIIAMLMVLSVTDIKECVIFDGHAYALIGTGLVYSLFRTVVQVINANQSSLFFTYSWDWFVHSPIVISILGGLTGTLAMLAIYWLGKLLAGRTAFGEGDIFILAGLGTVFGPKNVLFILLFGAIFQFLFIIPMYIKSLVQQKDWKLLISLLTLCIFGGLFCWSAYGLFTNDALMYTSMALLVVNTIYTCVCLIKSIKTEKSITFVPFGPFLALAGLIGLLLPQVFIFLANMFLSLVGITY